MKPRHFFWVLLAPIVFLLPSCQQGATTEKAAEINQDSVKMKIEAMENAFAVASNAKDVDGVAAYYASDAQSLAANEPTRVGIDAIKEGIRKDMAEDTLGTTISFTVTGVWAAGNYATETGTSTTKDKDGNVVNTGKYMTLFELRDGKYVAIRDIWNADKPKE
jgi:ketosteroid isomerase-like protein